MSERSRRPPLARMFVSRFLSPFIVRTPDPCPLERFDHSALGDVLREVARPDEVDVRVLRARRDDLARYIDSLAAADPDTLDGRDALAFWINAYNGIVLSVMASGAGSVVDAPGGFTARRWFIGNERLSLDGIEHGKIRRFRDPRAHFAIVCGWASCPRLRGEPYRGEALDEQLDDQTRSFIADGGARLDESTGTLWLSRLFGWYSGDFAYPSRMPSAFGSLIARAHPSSVLPFVVGYLTPDDAQCAERAELRVAFLDYDWSHRCAVREVRAR